jgi:RNA polymerase sigma-70 factor (ECF subfamily)
MPPTEASDCLLHRVARSDPDSVKECLERFSPLVWSICRRGLRDATAAQDAVQEIFLELWRSAARYRPEIASEATFVTMIARRRLIDMRRRAARRPEETELEDGHEAPSEEVLDSLEVADEASRARRALETLRPEQRRVVLMSVTGGIPHSEIARRTGLPLGTVKTHVRRGLARVRKALGAHEEASS